MILKAQQGQKISKSYAEIVQQAMINCSPVGGCQWPRAMPEVRAQRADMRQNPFAE